MSSRTIQYATFWKRFDAFTIDLLIILLISLMLLSLFIPIFQLKLTINFSNPHFLTTYLTFSEFVFIIYNTFFIARYGWTPGKKFYHIQVINKEEKKPTIKQALLREILGRCIDFLTFWLGNSLIFFNKKKQSFHDLIAKTYVISH